MNNASRFVLTDYDADSPGCGCRTNAREWAFCPKHQVIEDERHLDVLIQHEEKAKLNELLRS